ncbi:chorismate synthase [Porphyromonadaceae bacterium W3.11]|nr:chorismate synthase [Porphyromonadaceae bacterium W3.11]
MNSIGQRFVLTTFGESHGPYVGGVIDGCPPGLQVDYEHIEKMLLRRKGKSSISTARSEKDQPVFISGLLDGITTGTPIAYIFPNGDHKSNDYDPLKEIYRPSHADYSYQARYGIRDHRGGGRASARETVVRVVAGAIAIQLLEQQGVHILSYTSQIGNTSLPDKYNNDFTMEDVVKSITGCPSKKEDNMMYQALLKARDEGDSLGGTVSTIIQGAPAGWGNPLFDKLDARLAAAMMSIGAAKGFEMGDGFDMTRMKGSEANDPFEVINGKIVTATNHSGGVQGGITNGADICFRTAFKPIASISKKQKTINSQGDNTTIEITGRHDASVFPRVLPVVDAMTALTLVDIYLTRYKENL